MAGRNFQVLALAAVLAQAQGALAQGANDEEDLALAYGEKSFVSIATGTRQSLNRAPSAASVITAEDLANMGARTVDEALETIPGLHVSRSTAYMAANYHVRGIVSDYNPEVLMLVNGVPMTSMFVGNRGDMPVDLPVENISRIEVIRGPGSAVYGADAFAGTINIITKTGGELDGTSFGVRAGSFGSWDTWFQHGKKYGELEISSYLKIGASDGYRKTVQVDAQSSVDALGLAPAASLAPGSVNTGHDDIDGQLDVAYGRFRARAGYTRRSNIGTGSGIASALDPTGKMRSERITGEVGWSDPVFAQDLSMDLKASFTHLDNQVTTPLMLFPAGAFSGAFPDGMIGAPNKWERQMRLSAGWIYSGFADHRVRFGIGHDDLNLYKTSELKNFIQTPGLPVAIPLGYASGSNLFLTPHQRRINYLYLQDEWSLARNWTLTGGIRHDDYSDFGKTTNPRLALVWEARPDLTAKVMYGTAFRAPSFVEQYNGANPVAVGNASIMPEKIATFEGGLTWQARHNLKATLSLFRHEISDLIGTDGSRYENGGKQIGHGGEIEIEWQPSTTLNVVGSYAYQMNIDQETHHDAGYAPHHHLYTRADWRFISGWLASAQVNYVADRERAYGDNRPKVPDYTSVDLTIRSDQPKRGWDFSASIRNAFNADIREPSKTPSPFGILYDLPMPGRTWWLQARLGL